MTEVERSIVASHPPPNGPIGAGWSYIYVGLWNIWYTLKLRMISTIAAIVIFLLSAIELIAPFTHLIPDSGSHPTSPSFFHIYWVHYALALLLFITAVLMIWRHARLNAKVKRYRNLITFVMVLAGNIVKLKARYTAEDTVSILDGLIRALDTREPEKAIRKPLLNASILTRNDHSQEPFRIFAQDSCNAFKSDLTVPDKKSVAGKVVSFDIDLGRTGTLMYVPSTHYVHGIAIKSARAENNEEVFSETEIVPATYQVVDRATHIEVLKCLLCIQIPLKQLQNGESRSYSCAVLCLSGRKKDCMNSVYFLAAKLASALFSEIL